MNCSLLIIHPPSYTEERAYIFRVIFEEFLGLSYECKETPSNVVQIKLVGAPEAGFLTLTDVFFQKSIDEWLTLDSMPELQLDVWNVARDLPEAKLIKPIIPVIYGKPLELGTWFNHKDKTIQLGLDISGCVFFMLTRYEEMVLPDRDKHSRFPAKASLAYRRGFLERPIVDEYVEVLWTCIKRLWPGLRRRQRSYEVCLSHDIDYPLGAVNKPWPQVLRNIAGDLIKRKDLGLAYRRLVAKSRGNYDADPFNTFGFIMDVSEQYGLKNAFYFKTGFSSHEFEERYSLDLPWIQALLHQINQRGHEIGIHTSYDAYKSLALARGEFEMLLRVAERLKVVQERWGGRQHYLRWENPTTWQIWEEAGLDYDETLGFADHAGFRCGTCHEFPVFNLKTTKALRLRERPLIVMEGTLLSQQYMGLRSTQTLEWIERLSYICRCYVGTFTLLWHNTSLVEPWQRNLYLDVLKVLT